jgi:glycosyltransferase involved in cell wall biosynthesis
MLVTCICVCHNKPDLTNEAIESVVNQSYHDWELLIVDSGVLYDKGYYDNFPWRHDGRITLIRSDETEEIRQTKAMAPWCFNECFRKGLVKGDLVMYLCDDDILYPNAFETFISYVQFNPNAQAMYASQDIGVIYPNGWRAIVGERRADRPGGRAVGGKQMDCVVDYLQFCHRKDIVNVTGLWPEGKDTESHADGVFMEVVGSHVPIYPIDIKISQNRRTPASTYAPVK